MITRCVLHTQTWPLIKTITRLFASSRYLHSKYETSGNLLQLKAEGFLEISPLNSDPYLESLLATAPKQTIYCGFDPTASSLQLGNLAPLIALLRCQRLGHNIIALIGSATGFIGDPSGRETNRPAMLRESLLENATGMRQDISRILTNHEQICRSELDDSITLGSWEIVDNLDWYRDENVIEFLSRVGSNIKLRDLLSRDSVKLRVDSKEGMNIKEFLYPLFQAYDWAQLLQTRNCRFQIGGNDQTGNITSGQHFIEKMLGVKTFGLTIPLFTIGGKKVGKSSDSADTVWLSQIENGGSPYNLYQKLLKTPDFLVPDMLSKFTMLSANQRLLILQEHQMNPELRVAQKHLAEEITKLVHGEAALNLVLRATRVFFHDEQAPIPLSDCSALIKNPAYCPVLTVDKNATVGQLVEQVGRISAVRDNRSVDSETSKVQHLITSGRASLNNCPLSSLDEVLHLPDGAASILKLGKYDFWFVVRKPSESEDHRSPLMI